MFIAMYWWCRVRRVCILRVERRVGEVYCSGRGG